MNANLVPFELGVVMVLLPALALGIHLEAVAGLEGWWIAILAVRVEVRGLGADTPLVVGSFVVRDT
jgi:hypothetical protein